MAGTQTMRCRQITEWGGDLEAAERPVPDPDRGEVLVDVEATGVGRTVAHAVDGNFGRSDALLPRIPGHELVGRVTETGADVEDVDVGDRVGAYFYLTCGDCPYCNHDRENLCANFRGAVGATVDGGYAEYVTLPAENAIALPAGIDPVDATVVPDAVATPYHVADQRARIAPDDRVLVLGAGGGVGIHLLQVAQEFDAEVTALDRAGAKLDRCVELGAAHVVDTTETSLGEYASSEDLRFDSVVDLTGSMELVEEALSVLAPRGRLVHLTAFPGNDHPVSPADQVFAETAVLGSRYCTREEFRRAARLVADGAVEPVVSEVGDLADAPDLLERVRNDQLLGRGAVEP